MVIAGHELSEVQIKERIAYLQTRVLAVCGIWYLDENAEQADRARLLAAAPELLAELENIANANWRTWDEDYRTAGDFVAWAQSRARYAIAKTKGEE